MEKKWVLTNISIVDDAYVYASMPSYFATEDDAIEAALCNLSKDFGVSKDEVEENADISGTPTIVTMRSDDRREIYSIIEYCA